MTGWRERTHSSDEYPREASMNQRTGCEASFETSHPADRHEVPQAIAWQPISSPMEGSYLYIVSSFVWASTY